MVLAPVAMLFMSASIYHSSFKNEIEKKKKIMNHCTKIGLVELVAHLVVAFDQGDTEAGREEELLVLVGVLSFNDLFDVLVDCRVRANAVLVHERDQLCLGEHCWRGGRPVCKLDLRGLERYP